MKCIDVIREDETDNSSKITELVCIYYPDSANGVKPQDLTEKIKGIIHWVDAPTSEQVEVRLYDRLLTTETPGYDILKAFNPDSLKVYKNARVERSVAAKAREHLLSGEVDPCEFKYQFERVGYFALDSDSSVDKSENADSTSSRGFPASSLVFNRIVELKERETPKAKSTVQPERRRGLKNK